MDSVLPRLALAILVVATAVGAGYLVGSVTETVAVRPGEQPSAPVDTPSQAASQLPAFQSPASQPPAFQLSPLVAGTRYPAESGDNTTQRVVTIDEPSGVYVLGSRETVAGTAPTAVAAVAVYTRSTGDWELVDLNGDGERTVDDSIAVGADGRWEAPEVVLSNASGLVTVPGAYELGAVAVSDVVDENGTLQSTLSPGAFSAGRSARTPLFARPAVASEPLVFEDVADQVALEDRAVTVRGVATGSEEVLVLAVDGRGQLASDIVAVGSDDVFDSEFELVGADGDSLTRGFAVGQVVHAGRDGRIGDGEIRGEPAPDLADLQSHLRDRIERASERGSPLTQAQVLRVVEAETVGDTASDDIRVVDTFRITDALTTIDAVVPANTTGESDETRFGPVTAGETMSVRGTTNRRPNDTTLFVDLVDPTSGRVVADTETDAWGLSGNWEVTLSTAGVDPGNYTVRVDDGDDRDAVSVRVLPASAPTPVTGTQSTATGNRSTATSTVTGRLAGRSSHSAYCRLFPDRADPGVGVCR